MNNPNSSIVQLMVGAVVHVTEAYTNKKIASGTLTVTDEPVVKVGRKDIDIFSLIEIRFRKGESPELYIETEKSTEMLRQAKLGAEHGVYQ